MSVTQATIALVEAWRAFEKHANETLALDVSKAHPDEMFATLVRIKQADAAWNKAVQGLIAAMREAQQIRQGDPELAKIRARVTDLKERFDELMKLAPGQARREARMRNKECIALLGKIGACAPSDDRDREEKILVALRDGFAAMTK